MSEGVDSMAVKSGRDGAARRRRMGAAPVLVVLAAALAGCETVNEYTPDVGFEVLGPSGNNPQPPAQLAPSQIVKRNVAVVNSLEMGVMDRGRLLTAYGAAPATGWFRPELRARNAGRPGPDGFLEFDFVAAPPELNGGAVPPVGTDLQRRVRADRPIADRDIAAAVGVRVYADGGAAAMRFAAAPVVQDTVSPRRTRPVDAASPGVGPSAPIQ